MWKFACREVSCQKAYFILSSDFIINQPIFNTYKCDLKKLFHISHVWKIFLNTKFINKKMNQSQWNKIKEFLQMFFYINFFITIISNDEQTSLTPNHWEFHLSIEELVKNWKRIDVLVSSSIDWSSHLRNKIKGKTIWDRFSHFSQPCPHRRSQFSSAKYRIDLLEAKILPGGFWSTIKPLLNWRLYYSRKVYDKARCFLRLCPPETKIINFIKSIFLPESPE